MSQTPRFQRWGLAFSILAALVLGYAFTRERHRSSSIQSAVKAAFAAVRPAPLNQATASSSNVTIGRIFLISYVDDKRKQASGSPFGARSRACYARMHANHTFIQYSDRDFKGWIPTTSTSSNASIMYDPSSDDFHRARYYSKLIFVNRTLVEQNMTEHDWVFWMDSDTIITNPGVATESIIREACIDKRPKFGGEHTPGPVNKMRDIIVANVPNGINNGVFAMRNTAWSRQFLQRWWDDGFGSTDHAFDNGPFMHAILREMVEGQHDGNNTALYDGTCDGRVHPGKIMGGWTPFWTCYRHHLRRRLCNEANKFACMSRCPIGGHTDAEAWAGPAVDDERNLGTVFSFGSIAEGDDHIGGHCHINSGFGWGPTADWKEDSSWLLHLAGQSTEERGRVMSRVGPMVADRFTPSCAFL